MIRSPNWILCDQIFKLSYQKCNDHLISLSFEVFCARAPMRWGDVAQSCVNVTKSDFTENDLYRKSTFPMNFNLNPKVHRSRSHSFDLISSIVFNLCPIHFNMVIHAENLSSLDGHTPHRMDQTRSESVDIGLSK